MDLHKDKLIMKFLKSQQQKQEFQQLRDELKQSIMHTQASQQITESQLDQQLLLEQSMFMTMSAYAQPSANAPLSVTVDVKVQKVQLNLIINESGFSYDHIYEANLALEEMQMIDARFGYCYYTFTMNDMFTLVSIKNVMKKGQKSVDASKPMLNDDKMIDVKLQIKSIEGHRSDIHDCPHPKFIEQMKSQHSDSMNGQYESFASSSVFRSAHEFYSLGDSKVMGQSITTSASKRTHQQPGSTAKNAQTGLDQSFIAPEVLQVLLHPPALNPFQFNPYQQHYCTVKLFSLTQIKDSIISNTVQPPPSHDCSQQQMSTSPKAFIPNQIELRLQTYCEKLSKRETKMKTKFKVNLGTVSISISMSELVMMLFLTKGLQPSSKINTLPKQQVPPQNPHLIEIAQIKVEGLNFAIVGRSQQLRNQYQSQLMSLLGGIIENKPIDNLYQILCAHHGCPSEQSTSELFILSFKDIILIKDIKEHQLLIRLDFKEGQLSIPHQQQNIPKIPILTFNDITTEISSSQQTQNKKSQQTLRNLSAKDEQPFVVFFEDQDQHHSSQSHNSLGMSQSMKDSQNSSMMMERDTLRVNIYLEKVDIAIDLNQSIIKESLDTLLELDQTMKALLLIMDITKCYNRELLEKKQNKRKNQIQAQNHSSNFEVSVNIENLDIVIKESNGSTIQELFQIQMIDAGIKMKYQPPITSQTDQVKKEKISIKFNVFDILVIDFFQKAPVSMQLYDRNPDLGTSRIPKSEACHLAKSKFDQALLNFEHQIVLYRQLFNRERTNALDLNIDVVFKIEQEPFEQRTSVDHFVALLIKAMGQPGTPRDLISSMFDEVAQMKKNPMLCKLNIATNGLVVRMLMLSNPQFISKMLETSKQILSLLSKSRPPSNQQPTTVQSSDKFELKLSINTFSIDYKPSLTKQHYDKVYLSDFESVQLSQSLALDSKEPLLIVQAQKDQALQKEAPFYKTPVRSLIYFGQLGFTLRNYTVDTNKIVDMHIKGEDMSIQILQNPYVSDSDHDQPLLLDISQSLDKPGSLLDQIGFSQILYVDIFELKKTDSISAVLQNTSQNVPIIEEDLFSTSYGMPEPNVIPHQSEVKEEKRQTTVKLMIKQLAVYLAKDSLSALKVIGQMAALKGEQIATIFKDYLNSIQPEQPKQLFFNPIINEAYVPHSMHSSEETEEESLQKLLQEFLITDYDGSLKQEMQGLQSQDYLITNSSKSKNIEESKTLISSSNLKASQTSQKNPALPKPDPFYNVDKNQADYFTVNSALYVIKRNDIQKLPEAPALVNLNKYLVDNYLPVLSMSDVVANRHRECHNAHLPEQLKNISPQLKINVEVHSMELKLFEGSDFDFVTTPPQNGFGSTSITEFAKKQLAQREHISLIKKNRDTKSKDLQLKESWQSQSISQVQQQEESKTLFTFNEDYLAVNKKSTAKQKPLNSQQQSLQKETPIFVHMRRPRKYGRGRSLRLSINNAIFSMNTFQQGSSDHQDSEFNRYCISILKLNVIETLSSKSMHELLQTAPYQKHFDNQIEITIQRETLIGSLTEDIGLTVRLQPFKVLLNQQVLRFLLDFFDINLQAPAQVSPQQQEVNEDLYESVVEEKNPIQVEESKQKHQAMKNKHQVKRKVFISQIIIHPTYVILSYTSKDLKVLDLAWGNYLEFLNIIDINGLKINIPSYNLKQRLPIQVALSHLLKFYINDLITNQKVNMAKAIGPVRAAINITDAVCGLVLKPYKEAVDRGVLGAVRGLGDGAFGLLAVIAEETGLATPNK